MTKVAINRCYGGFGLSDEAKKLGRELSGDVKWAKWDHDINRDDITLIKVIERLGDVANDSLANLEIVEIPDDVTWKIDEYDGVEWVAESHRTWS